VSTFTMEFKFQRATYEYNVLHAQAHKAHAKLMSHFPLNIPLIKAIVKFYTAHIGLYITMFMLGPTACIPFNM